MGYYISHMIGIRTGGVFGGDTDMENLHDRIAAVIKELRGTSEDTDIPEDPAHCMSRELVGHKGSYVVLAGVFNYWNWSQASAFSRRLSAEFGTEVMHMCWDEEIGAVQCQVFLAGKPLFEVSENPIGRVLRRVT